MTTRRHYLGEGEQALQYVGGAHEFESLVPGRLGTRSVRVQGDGLDVALEQQQDAVHDAHDEMRRLRQLANCATDRRTALSDF